MLSHCCHTTVVVLLSPVLLRGLIAWEMSRMLHNLYTVRRHFSFSRVQKSHEAAQSTEKKANEAGSKMGEKVEEAKYDI